MTAAPAARPVPAIFTRRNPALLSLVLLVVFIAANAVLQANFFRLGVVSSNVMTFLPWMLVAVAQAYVVLGGSIDLSLGAIVSLVNVIVVVLAERLTGGGGLALAMVAGLGAGLACGVLNGLLIAALRLPAIVTTFATSIVFGGLALTVMPQAGGVMPSAYYGTFMGNFLGVPFVFLALAVLVAIVLWISRTQFHLHLLATGGNRQGAFQTGLPVTRIRMQSHALAGLIAAVAALAILGRTGAGDPLMGQALTLGSISAVVLGGAALAGGWGSALGAILGAAVLGLMNNVIFFADIPYQFQSIAQGVIILIALAAGTLFARKPK